MQSTPNLEEKCTLLGTVEFRHSNMSASETVSFYNDKQEQLYFTVNFVDPFDYSSSFQKLRPCKLPPEEVKRLLNKKKVLDHHRFYWD